MAGPTAAERTPTEAMRAAIDAWNRGDVDAIVALFHEHAEISSAPSREPIADEVYRGHEGVRHWIESITDSLRGEIEGGQTVEYDSLVLVLGATRGREWAALGRVEDGLFATLQTHLDHGDALIAFGRLVKAQRPPAPAGDSARTDVEIVRASTEAFARRDNAGVVRDYAPDIVWDMSSYPGWPGREEYVGLEEIRDFFREWLAPWEAWNWEVAEVVGVGDVVVVGGRDRGRLAGSDAEVERTIAQLWWVRGGRVVRIANFRTWDDAVAAARREGSGEPAA